MRHPIEKSPRDGTAIILEDDASGTYDVAHWSTEAGEWVGEDDQPTRITPTHWYPIPGDQYLSREDIRSRNQSQTGRARRLAVSSVAVTLFAAALIGAYFFRADVAAYVTRYAGQEDILGVNAIGGYITELLANQNSRKSNLVAQGEVEADPAASAPAEAQQAAQVQQIAVVPVAEAQQSPRDDRAEAGTHEAAVVSRATEGLDVQPQAEAAKSARLFEEEREKAADLVLEVAAARKELAAITEQNRQALEEERARGAALGRELATAQQENEKQAALLKASAEAAQLKQAEAAESTRSLEEQREKAAALALEAAVARKELAASAEQHRQALEEERARGAALARELAAAQRENEKQAALSKASGETVQLTQAEAARSLEEAREKAAAIETEAAAARKELAASAKQHLQALEEERGRRAALWSELATAQREIETKVAQLRQAGKETEQLKQVAESARTELRQYLQHERDRTEAMARDREPAPRTVGARVKPGPATGSPPPGAAQTVEVAAVMQPAAAEPKGDPEATRLIARAGLLLGQGDIGSARIVLERASETGSARASFMLAETYDPAILTAWGTYGTRGEVTKARELYAKAHAGGIPEAGNRLNALPQ